MNDCPQSTDGKFCRTRKYNPASGFSYKVTENSVEISTGI
jgi:hypothetical protein